MEVKYHKINLPLDLLDIMYFYIFVTTVSLITLTDIRVFKKNIEILFHQINIQVSTNSIYRDWSILKL